MALAVGVFLLLALVAFLLVPLWRPPLVAIDEGAGPASRLAALEDRKRAVYGAIRDAGFDLRTDKMSRQDYEREVATLKAEAVGILAQIEQLRTTPPRGPDQLEQKVARVRQHMAAPAIPSSRSEPDNQAGTRFCTQCGRRARPEDRFCGGCGTPLEAG